MLVHFMKGRLPWQSLIAKNLHKKYKMILEKKQATSIAQLCQGCPAPFAEFLSYTRSLKFDDNPNIQYLRQLFRDLYEQQGYPLSTIQDADWDWIERQSTAPSRGPVSARERESAGGSEAADGRGPEVSNSYSAAMRGSGYHTGAADSNGAHGGPTTTAAGGVSSAGPMPSSPVHSGGHTAAGGSAAAGMAAGMPTRRDGATAANLLFVNENKAGGAMAPSAANSGKAPSSAAPDMYPSAQRAEPGRAWSNPATYSVRRNALLFAPSASIKSLSLPPHSLPCSPPAGCAAPCSPSSERARVAQLTQDCDLGTRWPLTRGGS